MLTDASLNQPPRLASDDEARIILITGIMAAGKSTVAQALAERLPRSVHLRGDLFRRLIVNGREEMTRKPTAETIHQLQLRYRLAVETARQYRDAGFTVVYQDIIMGPDLEDAVARLRDGPLHVVVLCPSPDAVAEREAGRPKTGYAGWTPAELDNDLREHMPRVGLWLDTSNLTVDETVDAILGRLDAADTISRCSDA